MTCFFQVIIKHYHLIRHLSLCCFPANKNELSELFSNIPIKLWKRYFRMFCIHWKHPVFLCIKNDFVGFLRMLQEHSILPLWKRYFGTFCTRWKHPVFLCIKNVFVGFLRTLQEYSILAFWKRYYDNHLSGADKGDEPPSGSGRTAKQWWSKYTDQVLE